MFPNVTTLADVPLNGKKELKCADFFLDDSLLIHFVIQHLPDILQCDVKVMVHSCVQHSYEM